MLFVVVVAWGKNGKYVVGLDDRQRRGATPHTSKKRLGLDQ